MRDYIPTIDEMRLQVALGVCTVARRDVVVYKGNMKIDGTYDVGGVYRLYIYVTNMGLQRRTFDTGYTWISAFQRFLKEFEQSLPDGSKAYLTNPVPDTSYVSVFGEPGEDIHLLYTGSKLVRVEE